MIGLAVAALVLLGSLPAGRPAGIELVNASDNLRGHVAWAVDLFESHGLEAPFVSSVAFSPDHPRCDDVAGYFYPADHSILLCFDAQTMVRGTGETLHDREVRALLHELAHAWMHSHVTAQQRSAATSMLGAHSWDDPDDAWCHRGHELAAEAFVWWLTDGRVLPRPLASAERSDLEAVIDVLTAG